MLKKDILIIDGKEVTKFYSDENSYIIFVDEDEEKSKDDLSLEIVDNI